MVPDPPPPDDTTVPGDVDVNLGIECSCDTYHVENLLCRCRRCCFRSRSSGNSGEGCLGLVCLCRIPLSLHASRQDLGDRRKKRSAWKLRSRDCFRWKRIGVGSVVMCLPFSSCSSSIIRSIALFMRSFDSNSVASSCIWRGRYLSLFPPLP